MGRHGIQQGSLILPAADYLVRRFREDGAAIVTYEDVSAALTRLEAMNPTDPKREYGRDTIKAALRRHLGGSLSLAKEGITLAEGWDTDALAQSVDILKGAAEGQARNSERR